MSNYDAHEALVGSLLAPPELPLKIPSFQRSYSWEQENVSEFWDDITDFARRNPPDLKNPSTYFLGSVVLVERAGYLDVIDGQQRLATATILLSSIRDYLANLKDPGASTSVQDPYIAQRDGLRARTTYRLTLNDYDQPYFLKRIQEPQPDGAPPPKASHRSHRLISDARGFFDAKVAEHCDSRGAALTAKELALLVLERLSLVRVVAKDEDVGFEIFYSLNDRGENLAMPDKVRALLLRRAPETDRDAIAAAWDEILDLKRGAKVEDVLRYFWITRAGDIKARALHRVIDDDFKAREASKAPPTAREFTEELRKAATKYAALVAARDEDDSYQEQLEAISSLGARALYPVLLAIPESPEQSGKEQNDFLRRRGDLVNALITLYVRHTTIGRLSNALMEDWAFDYAQRLAASFTPETVDQIIAEVRSHAGDDPTFRSRFETAVARGKVAHYLLRMVEDQMRAAGSVKKVWKRSAHVEHIYPQTPTDAVKRFKDHEDWIDRIGNLTLLNRTRNIAASNKSYSVKRTEYYNDSDLVMLAQLPAQEDWNEPDIAERQSRLADYAIAAWPLP